MDTLLKRMGHYFLLLMCLVVVGTPILILSPWRREIAFIVLGLMLLSFIVFQIRDWHTAHKISRRLSIPFSDADQGLALNITEKVNIRRCSQTEFQCALADCWWAQASQGSM